MARHDRLSQWQMIPVIVFNDIPVQVLLDIISKQIDSERDSLSAGIELEENSSTRSQDSVPASLQTDSLNTR